MQRSWARSIHASTSRPGPGPDARSALRPRGRATGAGREVAHGCPAGGGRPSSASARPRSRRRGRRSAIAGTGPSAGRRGCATASAARRARRPRARPDPRLERFSSSPASPSTVASARSSWRSAAVRQRCRSSAVARRVPSSRAARRAARRDAADLGASSVRRRGRPARCRIIGRAAPCPPTGRSSRARTAARWRAPSRPSPVQVVQRGRRRTCGCVLERAAQLDLGVLPGGEQPVGLQHDALAEDHRGVGLVAAPPPSGRGGRGAQLEQAVDAGQLDRTAARPSAPPRSPRRARLPACRRPRHVGGHQVALARRPRPSETSTSSR